MFVNAEFKLGDIVRLIVDENDPEKGMVISITASLDGGISYGIRWPTATISNHASRELLLLTREEPILD